MAGKYVVGLKKFVERQMVDKFLSKNFRRHSTSSTKHFVEKYFVEKFSSTKHFVDTALRRHNISSTQHFVDIAFRRQITSSIESEEAHMIITELYWSYRKINRLKFDCIDLISRSHLILEEVALFFDAGVEKMILMYKRL